jgi:hypothetical protein
MAASFVCWFAKCVFLPAASLAGDSDAAALCRRRNRRTCSAWLLVLYLLARVNMVLATPAACAAVPGWVITLCYFGRLNLLSPGVKH